MNCHVAGTALRPAPLPHFLAGLQVSCSKAGGICAAELASRNTTADAPPPNQPPIISLRTADVLQQYVTIKRGIKCVWLCAHPWRHAMPCHAMCHDMDAHYCMHAKG